MSSPRWRGARTRGQWPGPAEGPSWDRTEVARRRHVGPHSESHPSPINTAPLAHDNHSSLLHTRSPADTWDVSLLKISVCCLMLPAHQRDHRRKYIPVPDAPRSGYRKPDGQQLCRTSMRQRDVHRLRTTMQRLIHSETNHQCQLLIRQQDSDQSPS